MEGLQAGSTGKPLAGRELGPFVRVPLCRCPQNSACSLNPAFLSISMAFIKIPSLNCIVTSGDFLLARRTADHLCPSVCVMQEVVSPEDVRVSWWLTREEMESQGIVDLPPPVSSDAFTNLIKCQIKEVIEDFSTVSQITVFHVLDLAFVFHANILETQYLNCAGMVRVFFTCNRFKDSIFSPLNFRLHSPFSNVYAESYFYYCMLNSNAIFLHYHRNHTEKHLHCDLSLSSISSKKELQLIRVDSEFSIRFIRNFLAPHLE
jgi:hypothetical protein